MVIPCNCHRHCSSSSWDMVFTRFDLDGLLWLWNLTSVIKSGLLLGLVNILCQFYQNCSSRS